MRQHPVIRDDYRLTDRSNESLQEGSEGKEIILVPYSLKERGHDQNFRGRRTHLINVDLGQRKQVVDGVTIPRAGGICEEGLIQVRKDHRRRHPSHLLVSLVGQLCWLPKAPHFPLGCPTPVYWTYPLEHSPKSECLPLLDSISLTF